MVTTFRTSAGSAGLGVNDAPHASQNCASGRHSTWQAGQRAASAFPQPSQKRAPLRFVFPQCAQITCGPNYQTRP